MSDWYEAVAVRDVHANESQSLADAVISRLVTDGIIQSEIDSETVLGGDGGHRPGPRIESVYKRSENEGPFWSLLTNGVEVCDGRWVNQFGFTCFDGFTCPACSAHFQLDHDAVADPFSKAIGSFLDGGNDLDVVCPSCNTSNAAPNWKTAPHFGFVNLAFQFWNWPPLNSDSWNIDIPALIASLTGHNVLVTYGRL